MKGWPADLGYRPPERIDLTLLDDDLADEWRHLRGFGWSDTRIAERLGVDLDTIKRRGYRRAERAAS
ncbi:polynucleotide kinase [Gordonia phage EdmundFerry]|nr:polynucleotide kinase [Gordonia phage EdmundFerry]